MKKHNCERCIHFRKGYLWLDDKKKFFDASDPVNMGICAKRIKAVNKCGYPCKFYELPLSWWKKILRKLVKK